MLLFFLSVGAQMSREQRWRRPLWNNTQMLPCGDDFDSKTLSMFTSSVISLKKHNSLHTHSKQSS